MRNAFYCVEYEREWKWAPFERGTAYCRLQNSNYTAHPWFVPNKWTSNLTKACVIQCDTNHNNSGTVWLNPLCAATGGPPWGSTVNENWILMADESLCSCSSIRGQIMFLRPVLMSIFGICSNNQQYWELLEFINIIKSLFTFTYWY